MTAVTFRPHSHELVWASDDGRVWWGNLLPGGRLLHNAGYLVRPGWKKALPHVHSLAFDPGGRFLAVGCGASVEVWNVEQERPVLLGRRGVGRVDCLAFDPRGDHVVGAYLQAGTTSDTRGYFVSRVGADGRLGGLILRTDNQSGLDGSLAFLRQGELVVYGLYVVAVPAPYEKKNGRELFAPARYDGDDTDYSPGVLASPHDDCVYVTGPRSELWRRGDRGWYRAAGRLSGSSAAAFHPGWPFLAFAGLTERADGFQTDGTVEVWSTNRTPSRIRTLHGHMDEVLSMSFSSDGRLLATASADQTVRLWSVGDLS
jgi:WD40 repeat protein